MVQKFIVFDSDIIICIDESLYEARLLRRAFGLQSRAAMSHLIISNNLIIIMINDNLSSPSSPHHRSFAIDIQIKITSSRVERLRRPLIIANL